MAVDKELGDLQEQQSERERNSVPRPPVTSEFLDAMSQTELKNVILDLFDQVRQANAKVVEMAAALEEKDRRNATLTDKLDAVLENQKQQKLDLESWLAKERQWNKERESFQKTIRDLNDLVKVLKKAKFVGTSQKSAKNGGKGPDGKKDGNGDAGSHPASAPEPDLAENKEGFDGKDEDGSIAAAADKDVKPDEIKAARNNGRTVQILGDMYSRLQHLLKEGHPPRGELMDKALNYMNTYWKQLTAWRKDGRYDIDNTLAERYIRPLSGERKNSLFYGSQKMAVVSATFHTLTATCHAKAISRLKYLKAIYRELVRGRTDYQNLIPGVLQVS